MLASSSKITLDLPSTSESNDQDKDVEDALEVDEQQAEAVEEALGNRTVADLMYAMRRLLRGLASPRESSRLGFAVVLTELLSRIRYAVNAKEILALVLTNSNPQVQRVGRSRRISCLPSSLHHESRAVGSARAANSDDSRFQAMQCAFSLRFSSDKPWMAESCAWVMVQAVAQLQRPDVQIEWAQAAQSWMTEQISSTKELSPEKLAVMLQLSHGAGADFFQNVALPSIAQGAPIVHRQPRPAGTSAQRGDPIRERGHCSCGALDLAGKPRSTLSGISSSTSSSTRIHGRDKDLFLPRLLPCCRRRDALCCCFFP